MAELRALAINHYLCPPGYGAARFMGEVAATGFGGVGLTIAALDEMGAANLASAAAANGLVVSSLNSAGNFTLTDPAALAIERARNLRLVEAAARLGARALVVVTGGLSGQTFFDDRELRSPRILTPADALARTRDELAALSETAAGHGVTLALEPIHPADILFKGVACSIAAGAALAREIPGLKLMIDTYHSWWDPDLYAPPDCMAGLQVCGLIQTTRDMKPDRDVLGSGILDLAPIIAAAARAAPEAVVEFELFDRHRRGRSVANLLETAARAWSDLPAPQKD